MRILSEHPFPEGKITIYAWNGKYIIKIEKGLLEQTYKIPGLDFPPQTDIYKLLDPKFVEEINNRFDDMEVSMNEAIRRFP